ncbi:threonine aldolase [Burkholderiaceae bacterium 16]|nr:threonine aldolase [Burkholderiaceae bacterium 16]
MHTRIDLYSDTKTRPSPGMRAAMADATVGDEQAGEDPATLTLCARVAGLLGMEAGVFLPSGTMANLVAILVHARPGDELIADSQSHIVCTEAAGAAAIGGVAVYPLESPHGIFDAAQVARAIRPPGRTSPRSAMLCVEQTTNFAGGAVWSIGQLKGVRDVAQDAGLACHMDGARLLNASAATGMAPSDYAQGWDSAWIDLTKGLGCPVGAVLCGTGRFIERAWEWKYRLGGAMRQSGVLAAAGLYALENHLEQLPRDHENAALIWRALAASQLFRFDPPVPQTNILRFAFSDARIDNAGFAGRCLERGVRVRAIDRGFVRVTTHLDISADMAAAAAATMLSVAHEMRGGASGD